MRRVKIATASAAYDVLIGENFLNEIGGMVNDVLPACTAAIVTDDVVDGLYGNTVAESLTAAGYRVLRYVFPNGERSKNIQIYADILEFLAKEQLTRSDMIVALGGGVVGDMAGFAAATYLRGIHYVQVPTTFLAAVDSSVGGKTAIDLSVGKNLAGTFYQPKLVVCDVKTLGTLSEEIFADGAAESIKYGVLSSPELFSIFEKGDVQAELMDIVRECVGIKRDFVNRDEYDTSARQFLNLGHTVGHAIEKLSNFTITHGHAVAAGMAVISRTAEYLGILPGADRIRIEGTLLRNHLPIRCNFEAKDLAQAALSDKKRRGDHINLILPKRIGSCRLSSVNVATLSELIRVGL